MKRSEQTKDNLLTWDSDQSWSSFLKPAGHLRLNTLDFSDLWDEDDSTEDEGTPSANDGYFGGPPAPPPLPPPPPPLPFSSPAGATIKSPTLKLHWRELQTLAPLPRMTRFGDRTIWARLEPVDLDKNQLEYLFKSKSSSASFNMVSSKQVSRKFLNSFHLILLKSQIEQRQ